MKAQLKTISLSLALLLSLSLILAPPPALAASEPDKPSRLTPEEVRAELAETRGQRIPEEEFDLYSKVFSNGDGTNTLTSYSHPVKYVDEKGEIRDISLKLKEEKDGGFRTEQSNILLELPERLSGGIALSHGGVGITMIPKDAEEKDAAGLLSKDRETVTYRIDEQTAYQYALSYTGLREVIEVASYTGRTEYAFTLRTGGLSLREERGGSFALYDKAGARKAALGDVIVFSADERNNTFGAMRAETVRENEEYTVTLLLDPDYLADERTVYPIRIDPDVTLPDTSVGTIEDVTVNNADPISATSNTISAGRYPSDSSLSYILMRFPYLNLSAISNSNQILSATVEIRDLMCQSEPLDLECRVYNQSATGWSEAGSPTWWSIPSESVYVGGYLDSRTITYGNGNVPDAPQRYGYNITSLAVNWKNGSNSPSKGIVFRPSAAFLAGSDGVYKTFASYNAASGFSPTLTIIYYAGTQSFLVEEGQTYNLASSLSVSGGTVTGWSSTNPSVATVNASGVVTGVHAGYTTVKAYVSYANGSTGTINSYVTVKLPTGVYTLYNMEQGLCFTSDSMINEGNTMLFGTTRYYPADDLIDRLRQQWKIEYIASGYYVIRPYNNLAMGLCNDDGQGDVCLRTIGTATTTSLDDEAWWEIYWSGNGYVIWNYYYDMESLALSYTNNAYLSYGDGDMTWAIQNPVEVFQDDTYLEIEQGILFYNANNLSYLSNPEVYIAPEETRTLSQLGLKTVVFRPDTNSQQHGWSVLQPAKASVNTSGTVTGISPGETTVFAEIPLSGIYSFYPLHVTEIPNGTYFLKNKENGDYARVKDETMTDAQNVAQYDFDGGMSERWIFTLNNRTGYYSIKSANSGGTSYYMAVENNSSSDGAQIVISSGTESTLTNGMKWKVAPTASGAYKIIPKTGEANDCVLCTGTIFGFNNTNIVQSEYVENSTYCDEWVLTMLRYGASVYNYFDNGYSVRYGESEATSVGKINSYIDAVSKQYLKIFGLEITAPSAIYYHSAIDACKGTVTNSNIDTLCSHPDPHTVLFGNSNSISNHFSNNTSPSGSEVISKAYWSGHCIRTNSSTDESNRCYSSGTSVYMLEISSSIFRNRDSKGILMHELNHQFGAPDHYHEKLDEGTPYERCRGGEICSVCGDLDKRRPPTCIMNNSRIDITASTVICDECQEDIFNHLNNHH